MHHTKSTDENTPVSVDSFPLPCPMEDGHTATLSALPFNDVIFTKQNKVFEVTWKRRVDLRCTSTGTCHGVPIQNLVPK